MVIYGDGAVMVIPSVSSIEWLTPVDFGIASGVVILFAVFEF